MCPYQEGKEEQVDTRDEEHELEKDEKDIEGYTDDKVGDDVKEDVDRVPDREGQREAEILVTDTHKAEKGDA